MAGIYCPECKAENINETYVCSNCLKLFLERPHVLPIVEFTEDLIRSYLNSKLSMQDYRNEIKKIKNFVASEKKKIKEFNFEEVTKENQIVFYAGDLLRKGTDGILESIKILEEFFLDRRKEHLFAGLEKMLSSSQNLRYLNILVELAREMIPRPKTCFNCGGSNSAYSNYCQKCNARLPRMTEERNISTMEFKEETLPEYQSSNYLQLKQAVEAYFDKKIAPLDFIEKINFQLKNMDFALAQAKQNPPPEGSPEQSIYIDIKTNLEKCRQILRSMKSRVEKGVDEGIFEDLREIEFMFQKLIKVQMEIQKN